jgi:hypothetical protein
MGEATSIRPTSNDVRRELCKMAEEEGLATREVRGESPVGSRWYVSCLQRRLAICADRQAWSVFRERANQRELVAG